MKKSKFLKKSLAMLLALMLVVAMIPLSASAASPVMTQVAAEVGDYTTTLTAGGGGNTYTGVVPNTATEITLRVLVRDGNEVYITDESTATPTEVKGNDDDGDTVWEITTIGSLSNYENEDGNYEIQFAVVNETAPSDRLDFTAILTPTVVSTDIDIETLTFERVIGGTVIPQWGETTITQEDIYVTIPYDAADHAGDVRIRNMTLSSGASAEIDGQSYAGVTNSNPVVIVDDEEQIVISNNGNSQTYTLHISVAPGFTSFTTEEGLDAVMFTETGDIAVLLPWGYTEGKDTVSVTPVFALDYDSAWASTTVNGSEFVSGENTLTVNSNDVYVATGNGNFKAFGDAEGQWDWADKKDSDDFGTFMHQVAVPDEDRASTLHVNYSENVFRTYNVYFFETRQNNEAEISELTIGSETAVIDQEAGTIDITVPVGTNVAALNSNGDDEGALDVDIVASNNATITIPMQNRTFTDGNEGTRNPDVAFDVEGNINATDPVIVRITSEDGLTTKEYELNVTVSDEYVNPEITDMALVSPDGETRVDAKPITDSQGRRVYYFQVPYEVYDKGELADWQLFWTKTVGATATYGANIAMPKTGARLIGNEAFLPEVGSKDVGGMITVNILGEELSERTRGYYIQIDRTTGKTDTTLANVAIYGVPNFAAADNGDLDDLHDTADVDSRFSYKGTLDDSTYTVTVPYSVYEEWDGNNKEFGAIIEAAEKSNARVFLLQGNGNLEPIVNYEVPYPNYMTKVVTDEYLGTNATSADWTLYDGSTIVVLSETAYVDLLQDGVVRGLGESNDNNPGVYEGCINDWDDVQTTINGWAAYTLDIEQATANTSANLRNVRLIDGTGWTAELDVEFESGAGNAGRLVADIPYALTSDFTVGNNGNVIINNNSFNPVYFEYDVDANAFVLGVNAGNGAGSWDSAQPEKQSDTIDVPTAGTDNDGVFIDIADYLEMYTDNYELALEHYYTDGNPFLLIDRDGTVYICNYDDNNTADPRDDQLTANTALDTNRIAAVSESGKDFEKYTFALDVKAANSGTEISSFYFAEYPNAQGVIGSDDIITVTLPYGTEYTYLTPVYEVSDGAIVTVDDPELNGKPLFPGYTDVNFSTSRKMTVIAENESDSTEYTIRVQIEERFSDVSPDDWFYDNVMGAAANGYISGMGDGTFNPKGATTRAQFASMIAKAMGYDDSLAGETRFKDVPADQWYAGAITYCFDNDIISGYDDGTFQPEKTITRQEAASILKNAFNLTGNSGEKFPDDSAIAGWAKENVYAVKHSGLMKGDADTGNFRPTSTIIRAEAASILMNANRAGLIK